MHPTRFGVLIFGALLLIAAQIGDAEAGPLKRGARRGEAVTQGSLIPRDRAAAIARSATGGRVLNIQMMRGQRPRYKIKMLLDGRRVRSLGIDAHSGAILK